jgi:hypothetical protein
MNIPTKPGGYRVHMIDIYGEQSTKIVKLFRDPKGNLLQRCMNDNSVTLTLGFGAKEEEWIALDSVDFHIAVARMHRAREKNFKLE